MEFPSTADHTANLKRPREPSPSDLFLLPARKYFAAASASTESPHAGGLLDPETTPKEHRDDPTRVAVQVVAAHYNERPSNTVLERAESPIFHLRCFNNWIKAVLMNRYLRRGDVVLDMGVGKGGDLQKYDKARIGELFAFVDVANVSIEQARDRYQSMRSRPSFMATFITLDCYNESILPHLPQSPHFHVNAVSMQFCAHYAFQTERQVRQMLENVSSKLASGGYFFGTIPDANLLVRKLRASDGLSFGNPIYTVAFEQRETYPVYGHQYTFKLVDAIDDCPEFLVHWPSFQQLASEYGLAQVEHTNFQRFYHQNADGPFRELLVRMKVVTAASPALSAPEWEAAGLYTTFAFQKR
ncbi:guanine-N(7)-methyltransferase domain-containing protein [Blastocladiella britannica]|nr:guanine-N(7)-methyltransferase domain-containing protein [Blastocladiella britannica]